MASERAQPVSLVDSVQPLRDHFNGNSATLRFVALLSPT